MATLPLPEAESFRKMGKREEPEVPMKCRVLLECDAGKIATSYLTMKNCGKTAIYYSWEVSIQGS